MANEASARIKINKLLEEAGWRLVQTEAGPANVVVEAQAKGPKVDAVDLGSDFEKTKDGFIDFLLLDERGFPFVVLEAKREEKDPVFGKEQARTYAKSQNVRFVMLSNGNLHYFWDIETGNPTIITKFPTLESLRHLDTFKPDPKSLIAEKVGTDYVVQTQLPGYAADPQYQDELARGQFIADTGLRFLRPYQTDAVKALQKAAKSGQNRFLFEMATGTGKTLTSAAVIRLFLRSGNAKRVLFLVDRLELETQAHKAFKSYLKNDYTAVIYKDNKNDWRKAEIVVTTVQSLMHNNKYQKNFSPTDFDLIISDEAHRSINGNARAVFEYFVGYKLGLTATPKDYLKRLSKLSEKDPREMERRQLLDTYKTFGCETGNPTFRYGLLDGVKDGFLVNPIVADARTEITTELLSEEGYSIMVENEEGEQEERLFHHNDFERKFFSEETNRIFCKTFLENSLKDPISGEVGKTIVFCVSQSHAARITQTLNEFATKLWPGQYNSDFAVQVTSGVQDAQQMTINFQNNNLNGHSRWEPDRYITSKTRVCVTVGMMTTGYDCQDILNLCLMRPVFSPSDFVQIKGRGTRNFTFEHKEKRGTEQELVQQEKSTFKFFDFFANCEYFETKFKYDEVLELPQPKQQARKIEDVIEVSNNDVSITEPDPLKMLKETKIGAEGMRIDRELFEKFEETIKHDDLVREAYNSGNIEEAVHRVQDVHINKPTEYFTLEKLRKALKLDRRLTIRELLDKAFGQINTFKSKDELLEEEFAKFVAINKPDNKYVVPLKTYFKAYVTDGEIRDIVEKKQFARLATNPKLTMEEFKALNGWREEVPEYVKDYVSLNTYV
jgi:type I restriction enzyme R subunit